METFNVMFAERSKLRLYYFISIAINIIIFLLIKDAAGNLFLNGLLLVIPIPILIGHFIKIIYNPTKTYNYLQWLIRIVLAYLLLFILTFIIYIILIRIFTATGTMNHSNIRDIGSRLVYYLFVSILNTIRIVILFYFLIYKLLNDKIIIKTVGSALSAPFNYNLFQSLFKLLLIASCLFYLILLLNESGNFGIFVKNLVVPIYYAYIIVDLILIFKKSGVPCEINNK